MHAPLIALLLGAAQITIDFAPDHTQPLIYMGDPLIIEVTASRDTRAVARLAAQSTQESRAWSSKEQEIELRAGSPSWIVYEEFPAARGYYALQFTLEHGGEATESRGYLSRLDRPYEGPPLPFTLSLEQETMPAAGLMRQVGVQAARIGIGGAGVREVLTAAREAGLAVSIYVDGDDLDALQEQVRGLALERCVDIQRWEFATRGEKGRLERLADAAHAVNCSAPIYAVLRDVDELRQLMQDGGHALVDGIVASGEAVDFSALMQWRDEIREGGYESIPLAVAGMQGGAESVARLDPGLLFRAYLQRLAGAANTGLDARLLYNGAPGELLPCLSGLARQPSSYLPFGLMVLSANVSVPVFRRGGDWCIVLHAATGAERVSLPLGDTASLSLTDQFGNPAELPAPDNGILDLRLDNRLLFLWGSGGTLLPRTARAHAGNIARRFMNSPQFEEYLAAGLRETVEAIAKDPGGVEGRTLYFQLVRYFPELEAQWHAGLLPRPVAVPAIGMLADLARFLCVMEQERQEPILEPMNDMLARAREYQSLYLTGTVGTNQPYGRGEWLLQEVKRLTTEADELADAGLRTEASAVAALAEWRARALEFAAKAGPQSTLNTIGPVAGNDARVPAASEFTVARAVHGPD